MSTDETYADRLLYQMAHALHVQQGSPRAILKTSLWLCEQAVHAEHGCIVTFEPDGDFKNVYLADRHFQYEDNELWQRLSELIRNARRTVNIGDLSVDQPWPRRETRQGAPLTGSAVAVTLQHESRLLGALLLYHSTPLFFDAGAVRLLERAAETIAVAFENAERFEMLADSQALYRRLYKDASFPTIITDLRGEIIDANPKAYETFGYDRQSLIGLPMAAVVRIGRAPLTTDNLESAANTEELDLAATARTAGGVSLAVRLFARRVRLDNADYLVWVAQDLSEQVAQEEHRRDLSAMVYHDLRGPLHNINLGLSRVDKLLKDRDPAVGELLELALASTHRMTRMVNSLLDIEQLESGRAELSRQPAVLADIVAQAAETTLLLGEDAGHEIVLGVDRDLPPVYVDVDMIVRVVINLLENAIKYTPSGGRVIVQSERAAGGFVRVLVSDSGPGIPAHMREQIFDKYVRVREKNRQSGLGLGLAFCRLAVEAHGGKIWVEDNDPCGARFILTLPFENPQPRTPA